MVRTITNNKPHNATRPNARRYPISGSHVRSHRREFQSPLTPHAQSRKQAIKNEKACHRASAAELAEPKPFASARLSAVQFVGSREGMPASQGVGFPIQMTTNT